MIIQTELLNRCYVERVMSNNAQYSKYDSWNAVFVLVRSGSGMRSSCVGYSISCVNSSGLMYRYSLYGYTETQQSERYSLVVY